jgi:hypothetical protein
MQAVASNIDQNPLELIQQLTAALVAKDAATVLKDAALGSKESVRSVESR